MSYTWRNSWICCSESNEWALFSSLDRLSNWEIFTMGWSSTLSISQNVPTLLSWNLQKQLISSSWIECSGYLLESWSTFKMRENFHNGVDVACTCYFWKHPIAPRLAQIADLVILHQMNRPFARYAADFYNMKNLIVDGRSIAHLISNLSERSFELKGFNIADFVVLNRLHQPIESWST